MKRKITVSIAAAAPLAIALIAAGCGILVERIESGG
jgi:hypothetical protein